LGRVLASRYGEIVVDRLFDGKTQLTRARPPLILAAERTLQLDEDRRRRTIVRVDAGGGSLDDVNWLLARGYLVHGKDYSGQQAKRLAKSVADWYADPQQPEGQFGWVPETTDASVHPVTRIAVRLAYVTCYDQRGGGVETSFKGDKQGLGIGNRRHVPRWLRVEPPTGVFRGCTRRLGEPVGEDEAA
jgi:hypothetical protein